MHDAGRASVPQIKLTLVITISWKRLMMSPCWAGNVMQDFQINIIRVSTTNLRWVWISVTSASRSGVRKMSSDYFLYKNFYTLLEHLKHFILQASLTHSIISSMPNYFLMKTSLTANRTTQSHYATNNYTREKSPFWLSTAEISAPLFLRNQLKKTNQKNLDSLSSELAWWL